MKEIGDISHLLKFEELLSERFTFLGVLLLAYVALFMQYAESSRWFIGNSIYDMFVRLWKCVLRP